jgi:hypothetical protein
MGRPRSIARRLLFVAVVVVQLALVARGYWSDHKEFAFQMFPESSTWRAEVVRVVADGARVPVEEPWDGYRWDELVGPGRLQALGARQHAEGGVDNQLAFLDRALDYVATHTPRDTSTRVLEARVTYWRNTDAPRVVVLRSRVRGPST